MLHDITGASEVTRRLLQYWNDPEEFETRRFFFCQIEAVETLIWLSEAPAAEKTGVEIPSETNGRGADDGPTVGRGADAQGAGMMEHMATTRSVDAKPAVRPGPEG